MAKLSDKTLTIVFNLQRRLLQRINEATETEAIIFEFGEEETFLELEQLQNVRKGQHLPTPDFTPCCYEWLSLNRRLLLLP